MNQKPYSEACDQNAQPIFDLLSQKTPPHSTLLEIGSGSGQHAVYFGKALPSVSWQTSDRQQNHSGITLWLEEYALDNVLPPLALDVLNDPWPKQQYDTVYSANTAHIMPTTAVEAMFQGVGQVLQEKGLFLLYGPFMDNGQQTSISNERFELWLKAQNPQQGVRDSVWLKELAESAGLKWLDDVQLPANNRILIWQKR
ncbi:MAG: DUF938 domain-containing protein [Gammaproteobacteria bacterium]|nr:DUF938 domain-containing protein [Gammaproteobacteria bacterium]